MGGSLWPDTANDGSHRWSKAGAATILGVSPLRYCFKNGVHALQYLCLSLGFNPRFVYPMQDCLE